MYQNELDSSPLTNVNCGASSLNWSYYKIAPSAATVGTSASTTSLFHVSLYTAEAKLILQNHRVPHLNLLQQIPPRTRPRPQYLLQ